MAVNEFDKQMQERFEGKIKCSCGNSDWRQFIYVAAGEKVLAGCKRCGGLQQFDEKDSTGQSTYNSAHS